MCGRFRALHFSFEVVTLSFLDSLHHALGRTHHNTRMVGSSLELDDLDHIGELDSVGLSGLRLRVLDVIPVRALHPALSGISAVRAAEDRVKVESKLVGARPSMARVRVHVGLTALQLNNHV